MASGGLRIAFVVDVIEGVKNGGVVSAQRFVAALRERHQVTVISTGAPGPGKVVLPAFTPPPFGRLMREMGFAFAVPRRAALEEVFRRADVVHVQFPFWLGFRAAAIARRLGTPLVAAFHVQPENLYRNVGIRWQRLDEWTYRLFLRKLFDRADAVVCPTPFALTELRRRGLQTPAEVISNGIAPEFGPAPLERPERHRGKFLLLAVGRLAREKRHDVILEGVRRSRHAHRIQLVVTGRGPEEARVRRLGATLPIPAEVGFLSDGELRRLLVTADLLVHASEVELEGMAVLEALGCGTPALVADSPASATPALAPSPDFLFRPGDAADLARRLDALLDDPARLVAARSRCLELAAEHALGASVTKLEALYLRLAGRSPPLHAPAPTGAAAPAARSRARPGGR
jgi:1,2-diacylglycerol 3-alpha-glucosyltransferase